MVDIKTRTEETLINNLTSAGEWEDNQIVFLLGAGCSRSSGIPGAQELASRWLQELHKQDPAKAAKFSGTQEPEAQYYFDIFSERFLASQRKTAIEAFTKTAYPGIGYATFAKLLHSSDKWGNRKEGRFKTILTTNFDNLIEQAFILFTPERPLVIPDPSLIGFLKDGSNISVVKIHGDSRYAPVNEHETVQEIPPSVTEALSKRIRRGILVVLGYAGTENGVAELISKLISLEVIEQIWWVDSKYPGLPFRQKLPGTFDGFHHVRVVQPDFDKFTLMLKQKIECVTHVSATRMDELIYKYHDRLMWRLGLYGRDGRPKIEISEKHFSDYFYLFVKAARVLEASTKDKDEALQILVSGLKNHSQSANYNILLGAFYKTIMGKRRKAIKLFEKAKKLAPEHSGARAELANTRKEIKNAMEPSVRSSIIKDFGEAEKLDPLNINNTLNYAGFLLALNSERGNKKGRSKLKDCEKNLYETQHRMEFAFYVFAHNIGEFNIPERLDELKGYLGKGFRSPDFYLGWNVKKAENDKHSHINLVRALEKSIKSKPTKDIKNVLNSIDTVLGKLKVAP